MQLFISNKSVDKTIKSLIKEIFYQLMWIFLKFTNKYLLVYSKQRELKKTLQMKCSLVAYRGIEPRTP